MGGLGAGVKRFIFWDYPRAGWQYDIIVGLILAFIFLTPRAWFRDQPKASSVVLLPSAGPNTVFWIEPDLLAGAAGPELSSRAGALLKAKTGKKHTITRLEPIFDSEKDIRGYMAFTAP
jgi:hypothetical protein